MNTEWIYELKNKIPEFLSYLRSKDKPGYYKYSLTGDYYNESTHWGLGNAVFAAKILYMLNALNSEDCDQISTYINSFQNAEGYIYDPEIQKKSRFYRWISQPIKSLDFNYILNEVPKRGETRQAFAALRCLGKRPNMPYLHIPYTKKGIEKYILSLNWRDPWGAGSNTSQLLFFLYNNHLLFNVYQNNTEELIDYALQITNRYQQKDGSWYTSGKNIPIIQKVNGAMKIMTAYNAVRKNDFSYPERLIDLCLSAINDRHACHNFNVIYVLYHCSRKTDYRIDEIKNFCSNRLEIYKRHYWHEYGGFSFFERNANSYYLGAKISKGLKEPDIHGTVLFLWGITLITKILGLEDIKLNIPIT